MNKILIMNGYSKQDDLLVACLHILFPECEIQVQSQGIETVEAVQKIIEPTSSKFHDQRRALELLIHGQ